MHASPSRNAPCPCGSGKKYKRCCGSGTQAPHTPAAPNGQIQQVISLYQQGNLQAASRLAEDLLLATPDDATLLEITAVIALHTGNPGLAIERFQQQLAIQPGNALAHSNLCMALRMTGDNDTAFQHGQQAILLDPELADAWNNLGNLYETGNKLEKAAEHYDKALALDDSDPRIHLNTGSVRLKLGELEKAEQHFRNALALKPDLASTHNNLGAVLVKQGRYSEALAAYLRAMQLQPDNPEILANYAGLLIQQDETVKARQYLEKALSIDPSHAGTYITLGILAERQNDAEAVTRNYQHALTLDPGNSTVHCNLGYRAFEQGMQSEAIEHLLQALESNPNSSKALAGLGKAMLRQDDVKLAREYIEKALVLSPLDEHAHMAMALLHERQHHDDAAMAEWESAIELNPDICDGYVGKATLLDNLGRPDEARAQFSTAEANKAISANLYHAWSALEEKLHRLDDAEKLARKALEQDPDYPGLTIMQAKLARRRKDNADALSLLDQLDAASIQNKQSLTNYQFERGDILDRLGRYTEAFADYEAGNRTKSEFTGTVYDAETDRARFDHLKEFFTKDHLQALQKQASAAGTIDTTPVFIVGFPRSGTSLLEQILGSHPQIIPAGELTFINDLTEREAANITGSKLPFPDLLLDTDVPLDRERAQRMRDFYLKGMETFGIKHNRTQWVTDKMPHNAMHLGLIATLFPDSPIIHIARHPLNSCLSAYFANFKSGHRYTSSLASTAQHYKAVMDMLEHYRSIGIPVLQIRYEDLVADQEGITRKVLEHIGVSWDAACLQHHKSDRVVKTASYEQVTQKIYTSSLYRYRNYREAVQPVIPILESTIERFGYTTD
jgi:Tfp pilus assembly protein PilF